MSLCVTTRRPTLSKSGAKHYAQSWYSECHTTTRKSDYFGDVANSIITKAGVGLYAVSYTHLDVYKRQLWFHPLMNP